MKRLSLIFSLLLLIMAEKSIAGGGADSARRNVIGVELLKPVFLIVSEAGFAGEIVYKRKLNKFFQSRSTINFTDYHIDREEEKFNLEVKGICFKQGIDFFMNPGNHSFNVIAGLSPFITYFKSSRTGVLKSNYYPEYESRPVVNNIFTGGIEPAFRMRWTLTHALDTEVSFRGNIFYYNEVKDWTVYYMPGSGKTLTRPGGIALTAGIEWKLNFSF